MTEAISVIPVCTFGEALAKWQALEDRRKKLEQALAYLRSNEDVAETEWASMPHPVSKHANKKRPRLVSERPVIIHRNRVYL